MLTAPTDPVPIRVVARNHGSKLSKFARRVLQDRCRADRRGQVIVAQDGFRGGEASLGQIAHLKESALVEELAELCGRSLVAQHDRHVYIGAARKLLVIPHPVDGAGQIGAPEPWRRDPRLQYPLTGAVPGFSNEHPVVLPTPLGRPR